MALKWSPAESHWCQTGQLSGQSHASPNTATFWLTRDILRDTSPWPYDVVTSVPDNGYKNGDPDNRTPAVMQGSQPIKADRPAKVGRGPDSSQPASQPSQAGRQGLQLQPASLGRQAGAATPASQPRQAGTHRDGSQGGKIINK